MVILITDRPARIFDFFCRFARERDIHWMLRIDLELREYDPEVVKFSDNTKLSTKLHPIASLTAIVSNGYPSFAVEARIRDLMLFGRRPYSTYVVNSAGAASKSNWSISVNKTISRLPAIFEQRHSNTLLPRWLIEIWDELPSSALSRCPRVKPQRALRSFPRTLTHFSLQHGMLLSLAHDSAAADSRSKIAPGGKCVRLKSDNHCALIWWQPASLDIVVEQY